MITLLLATLLSAAAVDEDVDADGLPLFTRDEPHLDDAFDALAHGDADMALEHAHAAVADDDDERAVVDYDIGQVLVARARAEQKLTAEKAPPKDAPAPGQPPENNAPKLDDAIAAFARAAAVARRPRLVSEAHLAAGNAGLEMQKLDDAIASYRKALLADPANVRARRNLQRALELRQQQPPPQDSGGGENDEKEQDEEQQKDGEQGDKQKPDDGDGEAKKDPEKGEKPKDGKGDEQDQQQPKPGDDEQKKEEEKPAAPEPSKKKPTSKEEARRLLQGVRSRERPLTPLEMRGTDKQRPKEGKDW